MTDRLPIRNRQRFLRSPNNRCFPLVMGLLWLALNQSVAAQTDLYTLQNPALDELSGLASAHQHTGLWAHNDSGDSPRLFRLGPKGEDLGEVTINGAKARDWEDMCSFHDQQGRPMLLLGDMGDNLASLKSIKLYAVPEPTPEQNEANVSWTLKLRYPDGARDAEALAVDPLEQKILILSKRDVPPRLYQASLAGGEQTLTFLGTVAIPQANELQRLISPRLAKYSRQPTAMSISRDGLMLVVVTYQQAFLWHRSAQQSWAEVLGNPGIPISTPFFQQTEGGEILDNGQTLVIGSEKLPAQLAHIRLPE